MADISKTAQAVKYFAQAHQSLPGHKAIPRKRLVKMLYMADVLAREYLGAPISSLQYYRDEYGPYDHHIKDVIKELIDAGLATEIIERDAEYLYKRLVDSGEPVKFDFSLGEAEILRYVALNYLSMPMKELLQDVVYLTTPMKENPPEGQDLNMDIMNNVGKEAVGVDLEEVLKAEAEIDNGKFATSF